MGMPSPNPAIEVQGLAKVFDGVAAVKDVSFSVPAGRTVALLGANGAGKTTTIAMLLGLILPSAGQIVILGEDMVRHRHRVLPMINFSSPYVDLPRRLTVEQNLLIFARLFGVAQPRARLADLAKDLDLSPFMKRPSGQLSAGQRTRVSVAKALINQPKVLLLDEPTASLDPDTADWMRGYLKAYQRRTGCAILLASHNMAEVERMAHEVLMMRQGEIVDRGTPAALIAKFGRRDMEEVFLDIARGVPPAGKIPGDSPAAGQTQDAVRVP
jgi:ABC-2 type transport system ATP-binding protein